jgi:5-methylthioadenosine/S-adenosylhomocysteine deaminase
VHLGDLIGSLEVGKRADLIVVDLEQTHNTPTFSRDPNSVYARLVYAAKSTDVVDVMCDGQWLMRDSRVLTVNEDEVRAEAREVARKIDTFLIAREESVLQKLVAIGGAAEEESFEVQVKSRVSTTDTVLAGLASAEVTVIRAVHYHQYDTYFFFDDPAQGRLRYREDEFLDEHGAVTSARARLTHMGPSREAAFGSVLLFRTRFFAPATHSPRFYREYFRPAREKQIEKDRRRWLVAFRGAQFYVHLDRLIDPPTEGYFVEVKSRTWSRHDAQDKAAIIAALLARLGARPEQAIEEDYVQL